MNMNNISEAMRIAQARSDIRGAVLFDEEPGVRVPYYVIMGGFITPQLFNQLIEEDEFNDIADNLLTNNYFAVILNNRSNIEEDVEEQPVIRDQLRNGTSIEKILNDYYGYILVPKYVVPFMIYREVDNNSFHLQDPLNQEVVAYPFENFGHRNPEELGNIEGDELQKQLVNNVFYADEEIPAFDYNKYKSYSNYVWRKAMVKSPHRHKEVETVVSDLAKELEVIRWVEYRLSVTPAKVQDDLIIIEEKIIETLEESGFWDHHWAKMLISLLWGLGVLTKEIEGILIADKEERTLAYVSRRRPSKGDYIKKMDLFSDLSEKKYYSDEEFEEAYKRFIDEYKPYSVERKYYPRFM